MHQQARQLLPRDRDVQFNHGDQHRIAGQNYYENVQHHTPHSIKMYLATTPSARLDAESIDNEHQFRHRFGFDASPVARSEFIAIKNQYQITDADICKLRRAGQISIRQTHARIAPDRLVPIVGWFYLLLVSLVCLADVLQIVYSHAPTWKQNMGLIVIFVLWLAVTWLVSTMHLHPWRLLKQVGAVPATKK
jgi:hypothetical protein